MEQPPLTTIEAIAAWQGVTLPAHRLAQATEAYQALAPALTALRALSFSFLDSVIEPAQADQWIEAGGVSS